MIFITKDSLGGGGGFYQGGESVTPPNEALIVICESFHFKAAPSLASSYLVTVTEFCKLVVKCKMQKCEEAVVTTQ